MPYGLAMRSLSTVAWGLILVVLDLTYDGVDVIPDPIGWLIALLALTSLSRVHPLFGTAAMACVAGGAVSVPEWFSATGGFVTLTTAVAETVLLFATCTGIMAVVPQERRTANLLRWWDLGLTPILLVALVPRHAIEDLGALVLMVGLAQLVIFVLFVALLFRASRSPQPAPVG